MEKTQEGPNVAWHLVSRIQQTNAVFTASTAATGASMMQAVFQTHTINPMPEPSMKNAIKTQARHPLST
jgi:hypothetical protein